MGTPIHPVVSSNGPTAPFTGQSGQAVGVEADAEITRFPIDVLILLIKTGSSRLAGVSQDHPNVFHKF